MAAGRTTRMTVDVPDPQHRRLKAIAALRGVPMKQIILECIDRELYSQNIPNAETVKVFQETDAGKNLYHYEEVDEMFKKLGIDPC